MPYQNKMLFLFLLCLFCIVPQTAQAICLGLRLSGVPSTMTFSGGSGEYNVYDPAEHMQTVSFQVTSPITLVTCDYFITISAGSSGNATQRRMTRGADRLDYNIYTTAAKTSVIKPLGSAGAGEVLTGLFPALLGVFQTQTKDFYWTIDPQQVQQSSMTRFQDTSLTVTLYAGILLGLYQAVDTRSITFQARVESSMDLSLVDTGGAFNIGDTSQTVDFGTLSTGALRSYDTLVRSNNAYRVTLQSQNAQRLQHAMQPGQYVPYQISMDGIAVNLTGGNAVQALTRSGVTPAAGDRLQTQITIGSMTGVENPGNYSDVITVTVSAQ